MPEYKIKEIPDYSDEKLNVIISMPDVPDPRGIGFEPVNAEIRREAKSELRKREHEKNIKALASASVKKWYEDFKYVFLTVVATLIVAYAVYYFGWNAIRGQRPTQSQEQKESATPASNIPNKFPKKTP